ncbi:MAG: protein-disulfide reductase DsbD [Burkholderiaceae bacterium]|nr:protein-disulfide reductase DsbD [Burkholderiaceae bacterium]
MLKSYLQRWLVLPLLLFLLVLAVPRARADDDFLDPELAFKFSAKMVDAKTAEVSYAIADGYYMYREHFKFRVEGAKLGTPAYPKGQIHFDDTFQKNVETYHHAVTVKLPVEAKGPFTLIAVGQGCAEKGLCYPPQEARITLTPPAAPAAKAASDVQATPSQGGGGGTPQTADVAPKPPVVSDAAAPVAPAASAVPAAVVATAANTAAVDSTADEADESSAFSKALKGRNFFVILPLFFLAGLGLSFTPCVLPMVPILSSIIVGEGENVTRSRSFALSVAYSLGMAIFYTAIGVAAGLAGRGLTASLQNPYVLGGFGLLIAVLSLSMFDVFQLQVPAAIQARMAEVSGKQSAGKMAGVFIMGALSGLIVGPCVAAPLIGALAVISQTHDALLGGTALFTMAVGMSTPLLLMGLSAGWLLPRVGKWMESIKYFFGVLLLGVAEWMVSPIVPPRVLMFGLAALGLGYGLYLVFSLRWGRIARAFGLVFTMFGTVQLAGGITNAPDAFQPLAALSGQPEAKTPFVRVKSVAQLDAILAAGHKTAMLDFYADWCVSCKEMEKLTFTDPKVKQKFSDMVLLQADVTANDDDDKALLKRFNLYGPPGIIFFDKDGREINGGRVVGYQKPQKFASSLDQALHHSA